jgi:hypothetical protein
VVVREGARGGGEVGKDFSTMPMHEEVSTSPCGAVVKPVGTGKWQRLWSKGAEHSLNLKPGRTL